MSCYRVHQHSVTIMKAEPEYQCHRRIYEGEMYQQHVFKKENIKKVYILIISSIEICALLRQAGVPMDAVFMHGKIRILLSSAIVFVRRA